MPYLLLFQKASPNCGSYCQDRRAHQSQAVAAPALRLSVPPKPSCGPVLPGHYTECPQLPHALRPGCWPSSAMTGLPRWGSHADGYFGL